VWLFYPLELLYIYSLRFFALHSVQYNIFDLTIVWWNFSFNLSGTFASYKTPKVILHINHQAWVRWFTSTSITLLFCIMDSRYLKCVTLGIIWSPTFTSKIELLCLLMKLHFIYSVLLLIVKHGMNCEQYPMSI